MWFQVFRGYKPIGGGENKKKPTFPNYGSHKEEKTSSQQILNQYILDFEKLSNENKIKEIKKKSEELKNVIRKNQIAKQEIKQPMEALFILEEKLIELLDEVEPPTVGQKMIF